MYDLKNMTFTLGIIFFFFFFLGVENTLGIRASPAELANFCTVWRMNSDFYLYLSTFSNTLFNRLSISFKYYLFIHYYYFFLTTTYLPTFFYSISNYYNRKKRFEE